VRQLRYGELWLDGPETALQAPRQPNGGKRRREGQVREGVPRNRDGPGESCCIWQSAGSPTWTRASLTRVGSALSECLKGNVTVVLDNGGLEMFKPASYNLLSAGAIESTLVDAGFCHREHPQSSRCCARAIGHSTV